MRHQTCAWDKIRITLELVGAGGAPLGGLTPSTAIRRVSDGLFWNEGGTTWQAGVAWANLTEPDGTNLPGYYEFVPDPDFHDEAAAADGYAVVVVEPIVGVREHVQIETLPTAATAAAVVQELMTTDPLSYMAGLGQTGLHLGGLLSAFQVGHFGAIENPNTNDWTTILTSGAAVAGQFKPDFGATPYGLDNLEHLIGAVGSLYHTGGTTERVRVTGVTTNYLLIQALDGSTVTPEVGAFLVLGLPTSPPEVLFGHGLSPYTAAGTVGNGIRRMLALRQDNTRVVYTAWNASRDPTAGYVLIYASKADLDADADPWTLAIGRYDWTATYDGSLRITGYKSGRTS